MEMVIFTHFSMGVDVETITQLKKNWLAFEFQVSL